MTIVKHMSNSCLLRRPPQLSVLLKIASLVTAAPTSSVVPLLLSTMPTTRSRRFPRTPLNARAARFRDGVLLSITTTPAALQPTISKAVPLVVASRAITVEIEVVTAVVCVVDSAKDTETT